LAQQTLSCGKFLAGSPSETLLSMVDERQNSISYVLPLAAYTEGPLVCANTPEKIKDEKIAPIYIEQKIIFKHIRIKFALALLRLLTLLLLLP
jgi:hypothetical protein